MIVIWRRKWQLTPVFLPGEFHWQRSPQAIVYGVAGVGHDWAAKHTVCLLHTTHLKLTNESLIVTNNWQSLEKAPYVWDRNKAVLNSDPLPHQEYWGLFLTVEEHKRRNNTSKRQDKQTKPVWTKPRVTGAVSNTEYSGGFLKSRPELSRNLVLEVLSPNINKTTQNKTEQNKAPSQEAVCKQFCVLVPMVRLNFPQEATIYS